MSETLGDRIRGARARLRLTQAELARRIGISATAMNAIEADEADPRASRILKLAEVLDVSPDYLLGYMRKRRKLRTEEGESGDLSPIESALVGSPA